MASQIKSLFRKGKDKGKGNHGSTNGSFHLNPRGNLVRPGTEEPINQHPTVPEENKYVPPSLLLHLDLRVLKPPWLTLPRAEPRDEYGIKILHGPERPCAEYATTHYRPESAKQSYSIIFVHSLTGRQLSTWTAPGATAPWLKSLLADDIPDARISAFGYDADVVNLLGSAGQNRIRHHATNLFRGVADMWLESEIISTGNGKEATVLICSGRITHYLRYA